MTEEEAKTKWCPVVGLAGAFFFSQKDEPHEVGSRNCIGSACMMWREYGPFSPDYKQKPCEVGGFCGLAGR